MVARVGSFGVVESFPEVSFSRTSSLQTIIKSLQTIIKSPQSRQGGHKEHGPLNPICSHRCPPFMLGFCKGFHLKNGILSQIIISNFSPSPILYRWVNWDPKRDYDCPMWPCESTGKTGPRIQGFWQSAGISVGGLRECTGAFGDILPKVLRPHIQSTIDIWGQSPQLHSLWSFLFGVLCLVTVCVLLAEECVCVCISTQRSLRWGEGGANMQESPKNWVPWKWGHSLCFSFPELPAQRPEPSHISCIKQEHK